MRSGEPSEVCNSGQKSSALGEDGQEEWVTMRTQRLKPESLVI